MTEQHITSNRTKALRAIAIVVVVLAAVVMAGLLLLMTFIEKLGGGAAAHDASDFKLNADGGSVLAAPATEKWAEENLGHLGEPTSVETHHYRMIDDLGEGYPFKNTTISYTYAGMTKQEAVDVYAKAGYEVESGSCESGADIDPELVEDPDVVKDCAFFDGYSDSMASSPMSVEVLWQKKRDGSTTGWVVFEYDPSDE